MSRSISRFPSLRRVVRGCRKCWGLFLTLLIVVSASLAVISRVAKPRVWQPSEVPIAFWSWRTTAPTSNDVHAAAQATKMQTIFLHAGQLDWQDKKLKRIRPVEGSIPQGVPVHLVYNATRSFLQDIEHLNPVEVSRAVISAFGEDSDRARGDQAKIAGLQLDFDVPTRLLGNYAAMLRKIREQLPAGTQLSITGLPTWLGSRGLREPLSLCDFWIPQCYGADIPQRVDQREPITSAEFVGSAIGMSRDLGVPFYAGLAGYGYAIHYSRDGTLIGLRGDLDPQTVVSNYRFELIEQKPFLIDGDRNERASEWHCRYRARRDVIIDGTAIREGESLLLTRPTSAGLRECSRKVRELGGRKLLGICVFRIPADGDCTNLTLPEIASAINDLDPQFSIEARAIQSTADKGSRQTIVTLEFSNSGSTTSKAGDQALSLIVHLPHNRVVASVAVDHQASADPVFMIQSTPVPCSPKRADAVRVTTAWWRPGSQLRLTIEVTDSSIDEVTVSYRSELDDSTWSLGSTTVVVERQSK